jgi:N-acyl-D-aspartate/D-glutamate deacylase
MSLWRGPTWKKLKLADFESRLKMIRDPQILAELIGEANARPSPFKLEDTFFLGEGDRPNYLADEDQSLTALAAAADESPAETWLRYAIESEGRALIVVRLFNRDLPSLSKLLSTDFCLPGLGDAGAHVSQIMDSGWGTFVLSYWARDRKFFSLEEAVRRITSEPARIMGLQTRGILETGKRADVNVIDLEGLGERMPRIVNDFPGGAPRFIQRGTGYRATICNGTVILRDDELTGARPGQLAS